MKKYSHQMASLPVVVMTVNEAMCCLSCCLRW